ncbi:MAG: TOBE domain-containing protein [Candidatus Scalindua sp.]|jgi:molybdate transport system regulatory protein|nr:TOBE domain-containing protein [Candidatus Scalindua sp.]MDV5166768.1 TOBE domain-containing protein [Candidatus Scalindua sp.]
MASKVSGTITKVIKGHIHANVQILWKSIPLSVVITKASCEDMHLSEGDSITVLIKGTDVMLAKSFSGMISARNRVSGKVKQIIEGDVVSKVFVESQDEMLHAVITNTSLKEMNISEGNEITAIVKSTELILYKET